MLTNRRNFIKQSLLATGCLAASPLLSYCRNTDEETEPITILHTNDMHSQLDAFPMDGSKYQGYGGVASRAELIKEIRAKENNVLLLDSGDIIGDNFYQKLYHGEPEMKAMNAMHYDAITIGDSDFLAGIENYAKLITRYNKVPVVVCNYDFRYTPLENKTIPYKTFQKGDIKIGVTGVGIDFQGLLSKDLYGQMQYLDAVEKANETSLILKRKENCDFIICLSHLGDWYPDKKMSDDILAKESEVIDVILGGHTHRFFNEPRKYVNKRGKEVVVTQAGWAGIELGRLDYNLLKNGKKFLSSKTLLIGKNYQD